MKNIIRRNYFVSFILYLSSIMGGFISFMIFTVICHSLLIPTAMGAITIVILIIIYNRKYTDLIVFDETNVVIGKLIFKKIYRYDEIVIKKEKYTFEEFRGGYVGEKRVCLISPKKHVGDISKLDELVSKKSD